MEVRKKKSPLFHYQLIQSLLIGKTTTPHYNNKNNNNNNKNKNSKFVSVLK